jgi:iron-sulfur cluster insertion protein
MSNVKEFSVEEKLTSLVTLQKVESKLDEYKILKGELPMEVSDLEDEIQGLHARQTRVEEEINGIQEFINQKKEIIKMTESTSEIEERHIVVTENAARRIAALRTQEEANGAFLRIAVSGGGCSGFQYGLSFDDQRNDDDFLFERDGIAVVVDDVSLGLLNGAEVDFVEDLMGASFRINNPNAASSCGCGNSFSIG